jgi:hypothetical protein
VSHPYRDPHVCTYMYIYTYVRMYTNIRRAKQRYIYHAWGRQLTPCSLHSQCTPCICIKRERLPVSQSISLFVSPCYPDLFTVFSLWRETDQADTACERERERETYSYSCSKRDLFIHSKRLIARTHAPRTATHAV